MIKRLMILSLLLVSMISKSWAYSFINGFCEYEVLSEEEQTVRLKCFVDPHNMSSDTDIALSVFVTDESTNITYQLTEINYNYTYDPNPKLGTLTIPVSVKKIEAISTIEFSSLIVAEGNPVYDSRNNCNAIIETATNKLLYGLKNTVIPSSVTCIGDNAFDGRSGLTSIVIPGSVTSIGSCAFAGCSGLTTITVEAGNPVYDSRNNCNAIIETATNELISGCKNTVIPSSVTSIGNDAFSGCSGLTGISIPSSVTSIGSWAFNDCSGLTGISIPSSVTSIGSCTFADCSGLTTITVDADNPVYDSRNNCNAIIETATNELISGCKNTVIPSSVTSIGNRAFDGCSGLTSISIPSSVTSIGGWAFSNCFGLTGISIPSSVTSIGFSAFSGCFGLTSVTCKSSTPPSLEEYVFTNISTSTLYVPAGSKAAYAAASVWNEFKEIIEIENITFADSKVKEICVANWDTNGDGELSYAEAAVSSIGKTFKDNKEITSFDELQYFTGVDTIKGSAFSGCNSLVSVTLPNTVKEIQQNAFYSTSLESIKIPASVNTIEAAAFNSCSNIKSIVVEERNAVYDSRNNCNGIVETATNTLIVGCMNTIIPDDITSIGASVFRGNHSLKQIVIPNSVTSIGKDAFYRCSALTSVTVGNSTPVELIDGSTFSNRANATLYVPAGSKAAYAAASVWNEFKEIIEIENITFADSKVKEICVANWDANKDGELCLAEALMVTSLGQKFRGNTAIISFKELQYFRSLNTLNDDFRDCSNLVDIKFPNSVKNIGDRTFKGCNKLTLADGLPENLEYIGVYAFSGCNNLGDIYIPETVTNIDYRAFRDSNPLSLTVDPDNTIYDSRNNCNAIIHKSDDGLLVGCSKTVIPEDVIYLNWYSFSGRIGLESIFIPSSVTSMGGGVFLGCSDLATITVDAGNPVFDSRNNCNAIIETSTNKLLYGCKNTVIPNSVTSIGEAAFRGYSGLTSIVIPSSVTSIGNRAFDACSSLTSVTCKSSTPLSLGEDVFSNRANATLYVPAGSKAAYEEASVWKDFKEIVEMEPTELTLTLNQYGKSTYCSEYALDFTNVEGLKAYVATGYNTRTGVVTMTRVMTTKGGTGLFLKGEQGSYQVPIIAESDDNTLNLLVGTLAQVTVNSKDDTYTNYKFTVKEGETEPGFYNFEDNSTLSANKAYLHIPTAWLPSTSAAKSVRMWFEDEEATGIDEINTNRPDGDTIYDMQGRRVKTPGKGIYIVNGKKMIIK